MRHWYVLPIVIVLAILPFGVRQIKLHQKEVAAAKLNASMQEHARKAEALIARSKKSVAETQKQLDEYYNRPADALEAIFARDLEQLDEKVSENMKHLRLSSDEITKMSQEALRMAEEALRASQELRRELAAPTLRIRIRAPQEPDSLY